MKLKYCSMTGADDRVDVANLSAIAAEYPFVEWAILLLPGHAGEPRFPSESWIRNFSAQYQGHHKAMHLCGDALLGFIAGDQAILSLMSGFKRIQLNLKYGDMDGKYSPAHLAARVKELPQWEFILQYGREKAELPPLFKDVPNHAFLFDESAGRGISPDSWDAPLAGHFCGYAGGLTPGNVAQNLEMISRVAAEKKTWIDMESGIRTDDRFDLDKVRAVLRIAAPYALD